jgi:hypothetical protein
MVKLFVSLLSNTHSNLDDQALLLFGKIYDKNNFQEENTTKKKRNKKKILCSTYIKKAFWSKLEL